VPKAATAIVLTASVLRVKDGDTFTCFIDWSDPIIGFDGRVKRVVRLADVNAPESHDPGGPEATAALTKLLPAGTSLVLTVKDAADDWGRLVAWAALPDGRDVGAVQVEAGHAQPWKKKGLLP
jgi:endonuclease YncB( thermonuclease family)